MKLLNLIIMLILSTSCVVPDSTSDLVFKELDLPVFTPVSPEDEITYEDIKTNILEAKGCINCHGNWANSEAGLLTRITPGDPFSSPFYLRMEDGSMPFGGPSLDSDELEYVENFIRGLAKNR